ncbi:MAG: sulfurtransferase [Burkholderiaceae bacterium]|jgi:thiosulfate/3-mercaptopyruvate sulfurtransferase|nr:sulfurtransferase [Burkholderiaceae bacterium]
MSNYRSLISAAELQALLSSDTPCVLIDCSFDLVDPAAGERAFAAGHLPGALYVHLDRDLSGAKTGRNGRHPLPERAALAERAGRWGIAPEVQVVCCDAQGMPYAARTWWLLRWLGHDAVAVLDGGIAAWTAAGGTLTQEATQAEPRPPYPALPPAMPTLQAAELLAQLGQRVVLDARAGERFRGEVEPLDPVAGHIPGALNRFFKDNLQADGRFRPADVLRAEFAALHPTPAQLVHQCGSGVTACHNLLAMEHAGLAGSALYPGSWSEWCADPARPVARGGP